MKENSHYESFYTGRHAVSAYGDSDAPCGYRVDSLLRHPVVSKVSAGGSISWIDIGCGKGIFLKAVGQKLPLTRVAGVDIASQELPGIDFRQCAVDHEPLPFPDSSFEVVSCNHVLEHVFHTEFLLREIHRITKPEGVFVVSVPNNAFWANRLLGLFGWSGPWAAEFGTESVEYGVPSFLRRQSLKGMKPSGHIRAFTPGALIDLCRSCGFRFAGWWRQTDKWYDIAPPAWRGILGVILTKT